MAAAKKKATKRKPAKKAKKKATKRRATKKKATKKKATKKKATKRKAAKKKVARKKATKKATRRKKATKKKVAKKKAKRKPNPAFMRPMSVSDALGAVVGNKPLPRTEVTKKLWAYIKKNGLQDKVNKRMINADDKLKKVFGGKSKVSMFEMTKLVSKHMK